MRELMWRKFYKMESGGKEVIRTHQVAQPLGAISCACITLGLVAITWYCSHNCAYEKLFIAEGGQTLLTWHQLCVIGNGFSPLYARLILTIAK